MMAFERRPLWQTILGTACLGLSFFVLAWIFRDASVLKAPWLWFSMTLAIWLLALAAIDLDRFLLPNWLTYPLIIIGLVYSIRFGVGPVQSILGAFIGYGFIAGLAWFWEARFGREGIGLGDAKLLSAIGAWCGIFALPIALLVSSGVAIAFVLIFSGVRKIPHTELIIPFGPLLCLGFWVAWVALQNSV
ncbi:MAG: prepilin peptidase [Henriciella sp.]